MHFLKANILTDLVELKVMEKIIKKNNRNEIDTEGPCEITFKWRIRVRPSQLLAINIMGMISVIFNVLFFDMTICTTFTVTSLLLAADILIPVFFRLIEGNI